MIAVISRVQWGGTTCLGLHNKERGRIGASVCYLARETYAGITSRSSAGAKESRLERKVQILPLSHSQYRRISQSNLFPNTRPGTESIGRCPGSHRRCLGGLCSHSPSTPSILPLYTTDRKPVWAAISALSSKWMRAPDQHCLRLPPPHNTQMHIHTEPDTTSHL